MPFLYPNQNQQEENKKQKPLIIFGTASFGTGTSQAKFSSPDLANPVLDLLRARGVTHIDTARAYPVGSPGTSEALLGSLKVAEWATVSTKVTSWAPGSHTEEKIRGSVRESLEALGVGDVKREGEEREDGTTAAVTEGVDVEGEAKETAAITLEEVVNQLPLQNGSEQQDEEEEEEEEAVADARERQQESQDAKKPHPQIDIMYLHSPDRTTPFPITCAAINSHHRAGHFRRFGLSNYRADEVEQIVAICEQNNYVKPTVYQGRYNAIIRGGEEELFPVLRKHGIGFYAYSPTAAGLFSGLVGEGSVNVEGSRWDSNTRLGVAYKEAYLKPSLLAAANRVAAAAKAAGLDGHAVALRWTVYHSILDGAKGDGVVLGASSVEQLGKNLDAIEAGPLSDELVGLVEEVWDSVKGEAADYCL